MRKDGDKFIKDKYDVINIDNEKKVLLPKKGKRSTDIPLKNFFSKSKLFNFYYFIHNYNS